MEGIQAANPVVVDGLYVPARLFLYCGKRMDRGYVIERNQAWDRHFRPGIVDFIHFGPSSFPDIHVFYPLL